MICLLKNQRKYNLPFFASDKDRPRRLANRNCDIRGQEDDLSCREGGEIRDKLWMMAGDILGLGVVLTVYRIVSHWSNSEKENNACEYVNCYVEIELDRVLIGSEWITLILILWLLFVWSLSVLCSDYLTKKDEDWLTARDKLEPGEWMGIDCDSLSSYRSQKRLKK